MNLLPLWLLQMQMILMKRFGIRPEDIAKLFLAGGFAEYLDVAQACRIGMIAPIPEDRQGARVYAGTDDRAVGVARVMLPKLVDEFRLDLEFMPAGAAGINPLLVLTGRTRKYLWGPAVALHLRFGNKAVAHERTILANIDNS